MSCSSVARSSPYASSTPPPAVSIPDDIASRALPLRRSTSTVSRTAATPAWIVPVGRRGGLASSGAPESCCSAPAAGRLMRREEARRWRGFIGRRAPQGPRGRGSAGVGLESRLLGRVKGRKGRRRGIVSARGDLLRSAPKPKEGELGNPWGKKGRGWIGVTSILHKQTAWSTK